MSKRRQRRQRMTQADPLHDVPHIRPKLSMLDRADNLRIHKAACQILQRTGVEVFNQRAIDLLGKAGASVDGSRVRIPASMVEQALTTVPSGFNLYKRGTDEVALRVDGTQIAFGPGSDTLRYLDPRSGERRDFQLADIADCARLVDALPELGFMMSVGVPRDAPGPIYYRYQFAEMLRNTTKPIVVVCNDLADMQAIVGMAAAAAGGIEQLRRYPTLLLYSEPTTPLSHAAEATDKLIYMAEQGLPITHSPAPMMGGTAPITLAGAVAIGNAEMLSSLVIHQLVNPGAPFLYGHGVHHLDMKEMISVYGAPEFQLARVMAAEQARFYNMPCWGYAGHSDSKVVDAQAAVDAQFSVQVALMAGTNLNHDMGYLESGLANSPEYMVLCNEIISQARRFMAGVRLDDEALALDVIDEVGPGGEFLTTPHSQDHWRQLWIPQVFNRQRLGPWEDAGSPTVNERLREITVEIMDTHTVPPLSEEADAEVTRILAAG